jgi:hypothetical protein
VRIVQVHHRGGPRRQAGEELALGVRDALDASKALEVLGLDGGDERRVGEGHGGEATHLPRPIHPQLDHRGHVLGAQAEERERQPHLVVEVPFGLQRGPADGEDGAHHLLGGGLAVAAPHRAERDGEAPAMEPPQPAERLQRVRDLVEREAGRDGGPGVLRLGYGPRGASGDDVLEEAVGVETLAAQRDEQRARSERARVGGDPVERRRGRCGGACPGGGDDLGVGEPGLGGHRRKRQAARAFASAARASAPSSKGRFSVPMIW